MSLFFSSGELLEIAIQIEEIGMAFYSTLADKTPVAEVKNLFNRLAHVEVRHKELFQKMLKDAGDFKPAETYSEEYEGYVKALTTNRVFPTGEAAREKAARTGDEVEAIDFAISLEMNAILFYSEMKNLVRETDRNTVEQITEEEKRHARLLTELKVGIVERRKG